MKWNWDSLGAVGEFDSHYADAFNTQLDTISTSMVSHDMRTILDKGQDLVSCFLSWRAGAAPSIPSVIDGLTAYFEIPDNHPYADGLMTAALLANIPHTNFYHNNHHFYQQV